MTRLNKRHNIQKKLSYKFFKLLESYDSKKLLLEQVDTTHCGGQKFLLPISDEEYNRIPKGNDGRILFCKYKTPMGPMFIKSNSKFFTSKAKTDADFEEHFKKNNITNQSQKDKVKQDTNLYIPEGILSGFNDGTKYSLNLNWTWDGSELPTVYSLGYVDSNGKPYEGPTFSKKIKSVSPADVITNLFTAYKNWEKDREYWEDALEKKEFLKILDDNGNVREDVNLSSEEIRKAKEQFEVFNKIQQKNASQYSEELTDRTLAQLPEFNYVRILPDGKVEKLSNPPQEWSSEYGGTYMSDPPLEITEAETGNKFSVKRPGYDKSRMYETNFKYKEYYSPFELKNQIITYLQDINVDSAVSENILKDELYKNEILTRLFKPEQIKAALNDCATQASYNFLISIIQGDLVGRHGYPVGRYFMKDGVKTLEDYVPKYNVNPEYGDIPCEDAFWHEYGLGIQMLLGLAAGVLYPVGGFAFWAALFVDVVVNAYSLTKSMSAQDPKRAQLDIAYIVLPFLLETQAFKGLINSVKFGSKYKVIAESLTQKIKSLPKINGKYDLVQLKQFFDDLPPEEARLLKYLGKPEFKEVMETAGREIKDTLKQNKPKFKMSKFRRTLDTSSSIFFYGLPAGVHIFDIYLSRIEKTLGTSLTEQQTNFFNFILSHISEKDREKMANLAQKDLMEFLAKADEMAQERSEEIIAAKEEEANLKAEKEYVESLLIQEPTCEEITDDIRALAKKHGITINCEFLNPQVKTAIENEKRELESQDLNN